MAEEQQDVETLKRRGRRRLVGAVALVLLAVIVLPTLAPRITRWHMASLSGPRAASAEELAQHVKGAECFASPAAAFEAALSRANENDKIVVFGSFLTVGEVIGWLKNNKTSKR